MPKVSVVVPAYNHHAYIGEAIQSIIDGDFNDLEVIVVDDGSSDSTRLEVAKFPKVKYFYQDNSGAHAAINAGISKCTGEFIAILNDDDIFLHNHLRQAVLNMEKFGNDLYVGKAEIFGHGTKFASLKGHVKASDFAIAEYGYMQSLFKINWSLSTSSFVFKNSLFTALDGFRHYKMCHDLDFLLRAVFLEKVNFGVSLDPTWQYRCHESNSGSSIAFIQIQFEILFVIYQLFRELDYDCTSLKFNQLINYGIPTKMIDFFSHLNLDEIFQSNDDIQSRVQLLVTQYTNS